MPDEQPNPTEPKVEYVVPDPDGGIFTTYANNIQLGFTLFDIRMLFGEIVEAQPDKIVVEQRAQVTISYLQAKLMVFMLTQAIAAHEARVGEIRVPEGALDLNTILTQAKVPPGTNTGR